MSYSTAIESDTEELLRLVVEFRKTTQRLVVALQVDRMGRIRQRDDLASITLLHDTTAAITKRLDNMRGTYF